MKGESKRKYYELLQSAAQHIMATTGINEEAHEQSSATTRGGEHIIHTSYKNNYCDGFNKHQTYYRGDGSYRFYSSNGDYTGGELDYYGYDSCGYNDDEANYAYNIYYHSNDGYGTNNSNGDYARATINNYNDGSCGHTSYKEEYGCYNNTYGGNHCETEYSGYYNEYAGAKTGGYETNYPPQKKKRCTA